MKILKKLIKIIQLEILSFMVLIDDINSCSADGPEIEKKKKEIRDWRDSKLAEIKAL